MDEIVKLVQEKTGLNEGQARMAVETVVGFLKDRLPAPIAGQIDGVLAGGSSGGVGGQVSDLLGGLGGMLGGDKK